LPRLELLVVVSCWYIIGPANACQLESLLATNRFCRRMRRGDDIVGRNLYSILAMFPNLISGTSVALSKGTTARNRFPVKRQPATAEERITKASYCQLPQPRSLANYDLYAWVFFCPRF
jgi:hypothetical protein